MGDKDGSRAIATINFLLDTKTRGERVRVDHAWNVHLSAASRDNTDNILLLFKSGWQAEEEAEGEAEAAAEHSDDSYSSVDPQALIAAAGKVKVLSTAAIMGPLIPCLAADTHQDSSNSTAQQGPISNTISGGSIRPAADMPPVGVSTALAAAAASAQDSTPVEAPTPQVSAAALQLRPTNSTSSSNNPAGNAAGEQMSAGLSVGATQSSGCRADKDSLRAMLGEVAAPAKAVSPVIEGTTAAEEEDEMPPYADNTAVSRALYQLRRVQAGCKLPACLQPVRPAQGLNAAAAASVANTGRISPTAVATSAAAAPLTCPVNDSLDQFVAGAAPGPYNSSSNSLNSPHSKSCSNLAAADPMPARPRILQAQQTAQHVHWNSQQQQQQQELQAPPKQQQLLAAGRQRQQSLSARSSASAIACAGQAAAAGKSSVGPAGGVLSAQSSIMMLTPTSPLYEPTYEDLKPYLRSNGGEEGVEALINRRLQQAAAEAAVPVGVKAGKLPPSQRYMTTIAEEHGKYKLLQQQQ